MNTVTRARWTPQYYQKVLSYDPIAYWMMNEDQGTIAYDMVTARNAGAQNGAYTGVTLGQPGIGDGNTCPLFDGANDYNDIYSAGYAGVFDGDEGTITLWLQVSGAGIWADGAQHYLVSIRADNDNYVAVFKSATNNRLTFLRRGGAANKQVNYDTAAPTEWIFVALTWSVSAGINGEMRAWYGTSGTFGQVGITQTALNAWGGAGLDNIRTVIGASVTTPGSVWDGLVAHVVSFDRALSHAELSDLFTI